MFRLPKKSGNRIVRVVIREAGREDLPQLIPRLDGVEQGVDYSREEGGEK